MTRYERLKQVENNFVITSSERNFILTCDEKNLDYVIRSVERSAYHREEGENI